MFASLLAPLLDTLRPHFSLSKSRLETPRQSLETRGIPNLSLV